VDALRTGSICGAAIDVHESEPLPAGHPLTTFDSVVLTPHLAWYTEESYDELKRRTVANVLAVCAGRAPRNIVNPEVLGAAGRNVRCARFDTAHTAQPAVQSSATQSPATVSEADAALLQPASGV